MVRFIPTFLGGFQCILYIYYIIRKYMNEIRKVKIYLEIYSNLYYSERVYGTESEIFWREIDQKIDQFERLTIFQF